MTGERLEPERLDDEERIDWALAAPDHKPPSPIWKALLVLLLLAAVIVVAGIVFMKTISP